MTHKTLHFPEIFQKLLSARGIAEEAYDEFVNPQYDKLHDPLLLPDMERARDRIIRAVQEGEHIVIFSDYDADGIPGAVVMSDLFQRIGYDNVSFYIPHRHNEGFGLNVEAVEECAERGGKLLITIDCGIADLTEVARANELGMEVIITDHHEPMEDLPPAYAVVNPKRRDSTYPFPEICGAAVAYKLMQAVLSKESFGVKPGMEKWSLDVVGLATLSDMVPLVGENRILASFGLDVLRKSPRKGLRALLNKLRINQRYLNEDDIAFMITPRINAASRMGVPMDAFKLLATDDVKEAEVLANHLEAINNERKGVVASVVKEAKAQLAKRSDLRGVIVIGSPKWRPALVGLVANSLVEEYERPTFVWGRDGDGGLKGSCRSNGKVDLHALMSATSDSFKAYGGHSQAGGFSITLEQVATLEAELSEAVTQLVELEVESAHSDVLIDVQDVGESLWGTVSLFAPFGTGNPKPVFKISSAEIKSVRQFGKEKNHLELSLGNGAGQAVKAISFFSSPESYSATVAEHGKVHLLANLEKSYFMNRPELRLRIVDIMPV